MLVYPKTRLIFGLLFGYKICNKYILAAISCVISIIYPPVLSQLLAHLVHMHTTQQCVRGKQHVDSWNGRSSRPFHRWRTPLINRLGLQSGITSTFVPFFTLKLWWLLHTPATTRQAPLSCVWMFEGSIAAPQASTWQMENSFIRRLM